MGDDVLCPEHYDARIQIQATSQFLMFAQLQREENPPTLTEQPTQPYFDDGEVDREIDDVESDGDFDDEGFDDENFGV